MQVSEIKDLYATSRRVFSEKKTAAALSAVDKAIAGCIASGNEVHALMAVGQALRAEILLASAPDTSDHAEAMLRAVSLCHAMMADDFEDAAPVLLNAVRYYLATGKKSAAYDVTAALLRGCNGYYGAHHPRWFQLRQWLDEAGLTT